jgi:ORF6N domain
MPARTPAIEVAAERVSQFILVIRRQRVLLDEDLAALYGVETRSLLQAVKRNLERFPSDFMFELSATEWAALRSQSVTSKPGRGGRRYAPYAFTEQGVAMLSSVLNSGRAIAVNIEIMRSFVRIRRLLEVDKSLARKFDRLERKLASHDQAILGILAAIRQLMNPPEPKRRGIGFTADLKA